MNIVYKYPIKFGLNSLHLPVGAQFLHFAGGHGSFMAWFEVDASAESNVRNFKIFGTGHHLENVLNYLSTVIDEGFVWHLYEVAA